ncbi:MAG: hypothetical protein V3U65_18085 [Granulosicoccaceae bacterium]
MEYEIGEGLNARYPVMLALTHGQSTQIFPPSSIYAGLEMVASVIGVGLFPLPLSNI